MVNGAPMSEFLLHSLAAAELGVPTAFISGDRLLCEDARAARPGIHTVATNTGKGATTESIHPACATAAIRGGMGAALQDPATRALPWLSDHYTVEIWYLENEHAYAASIWPGASLHAPHAVRFESGRFYEVMRMLEFVL